MKKPPVFVFALNDIPLSDGIIRQNEVGIMASEGRENCIVNFIVGNRIIEVGKNQIGIFDPMKTGDLFEKKVCNVCHRLLNTEYFQKNQNGKGDRPIRRPSCNDCRKIIDGKPVSQKERNEWNTQKPNMEIFECPICHKITIPGLTSKIVLDHNHNTGHVRGWICDSCNTGIGRFKDDIKLLKSAIEYLEKQSTQRKPD